MLLRAVSGALSRQRVAEARERRLPDDPGRAEYLGVSFRRRSAPTRCGRTRPGISKSGVSATPFSRGERASLINQVERDQQRLGHRQQPVDDRFSRRESDSTADRTDTPRCAVGHSSGSTSTLGARGAVVCPSPYGECRTRDRFWRMIEVDSHVWLNTPCQTFTTGCQAATGSVWRAGPGARYSVEIRRFSSSCQLRTT